MTYLDGKPREDRSGISRSGRIDYREVLKPDEFQRFSALRDLRRKIAEEESVPVYTIFTNEQLAQMARHANLGRAELAAPRSTASVMPS